MSKAETIFHYPDIYVHAAFAPNKLIERLIIDGSKTPQNNGSPSEVYNRFKFLKSNYTKSNINEIPLSRTSVALVSDSIFPEIGIWSIFRPNTTAILLSSRQKLMERRIKEEWVDVEEDEIIRLSLRNGHYNTKIHTRDYFMYPNRIDSNYTLKRKDGNYETFFDKKKPNLPLLIELSDFIEESYNNPKRSKINEMFYLTSRYPHLPRIYLSK